MHRVNPTIKARSDSKPAQIYIEYLFDRTHRKLFPTGRRVLPEDWNHDKREVRKSHPEHVAINMVVNDLRRRIQEIADKAVISGDVPSISYVTAAFASDSPSKSNASKDLEGILQKWIDDSSDRITPSALKHYSVFRNHLRGYMKWKRISLIPYDLTTEEFHTQFRRYLETQVMVDGKKGLMRSTVVAQYKRLKTFLNYCLRNDHLNKLNLPPTKFGSESSENVFVNDAELDSIENLDLTDKPALESIRDIFLIGCETGLRYSDLSALRLTHFSDNFIRKPTHKTSKKVIIPISSRLKRVLERNGGTLPKAPSSGNFNKKIKEVCRMAGLTSTFTWLEQRGNRKEELSAAKYEVISSHTCRRSFCTNQFLKGMPNFLIRKISGHTTEKAFLQYIRIDEEQAAEEMARRWAVLQENQ